MKKMSKEEIISIVKKAFTGVKLNGGVSLKQAEAIDNFSVGISKSEFNRFPLTETTNDWSLIPDDVLDKFEFVAHLDAKGFKYYIPAFMIRLLNNYDGSMMIIGTLLGLYPKKDSWKYCMEKYSLFSEEQQKAIAQFLTALPDLVDLDHEDIKVVQRALRNYWAGFLSEL